MAERKTYHVTKKGDHWQGKAEGGQRASTTGSTKEEVVQKTTDLARNQGNSSVVIHKQDGKFQEERTYDNDPFPPRG